MSDSLLIATHLITNLDPIHTNIDVLFYMYITLHFSTAAQIAQVASPILKALAGQIRQSVQQ